VKPDRIIVVRFVGQSNRQETVRWLKDLLEKARAKRNNQA